MVGSHSVFSIGGDVPFAGIAEIAFAVADNIVHALESEPGLKKLDKNGYVAAVVDALHKQFPEGKRVTYLDLIEAIPALVTDLKSIL